MNQVKLLRVCPECGQVLFDLTDEGISFRNCNHFVWHSSLGSIANDEAILQGGLDIRLLKR